MDLLSSLLLLVLGSVFLIVYARDRRGKQFAQGQPAVLAVVRKVEKSTYQSDGRTRWEIDLIFEAIGFGTLRNEHTFASQEEAEEWAQTYPIGSKHRIKPSPVDRQKAFLEGEENQSSWPWLLIGVVFFGAGIFLAIHAS
jgi:hypothetical protein